MALTESQMDLRLVKRVQFGILSPDEIVCKCFMLFWFGLLF